MPNTQVIEIPRALPTVNCSGRHLRTITQQCLIALKQANDPPVLFVRGGQLVRTRSDEMGHPIIELVGEHELRARLTEVADFCRTRKKEPIPIYPPIVVVQNLRALGQWPFPPLEGITEIPIMREDGTIFSTPGYDLATHLFYKPAATFKLGAVPDRPSPGDLTAAVQFIDEALGEFPYVDQVSRANAIGLFITTVLRRFIPGIAPLALIDAPNAGTGKGLLTNICSIMATGHAAPVKPYPGTEEEVRKTIGSMMLEGSSIACFDNLDQKLDSPNLAAALTSDIYSDRILGLSKTMRVPNRATWIINGNNIQLGGDIPRRCFHIRMDARMSRPFLDRQFKHPNLMEWVTEHRGDLLAAIFTLARSWIKAGQPPGHNVTIGGYEGWSRTIGGILYHCGIEGFLGTLMTSIPSPTSRISNGRLSYSRFASGSAMLRSRRPNLRTEQQRLMLTQGIRSLRSLPQAICLA